MFYSVLQQFSVFFGQRMPLKLRWTLMSNWINVEDDIDHDEDEEAPRWSQGWWHWHVTSCDIGGHRDIEDDKIMMIWSGVSGVWSWRQLEGDNARWEMFLMYDDCQKSSQSPGASPHCLCRPSHNITSYKMSKCSHVTPSQENWWLGKNLQTFWKHFSLWLSSGFGLNPWKRTGKRMWK